MDRSHKINRDDAAVAADKLEFQLTEVSNNEILEQRNLGNIPRNMQSLRNLSNRTLGGSTRNASSVMVTEDEEAMYTINYSNSDMETELQRRNSLDRSEIRRNLNLNCKVVP